MSAFFVTQRGTVGEGGIWWLEQSLFVDCVEATSPQPKCQPLSGGGPQPQPVCPRARHAVVPQAVAPLPGCTGQHASLAPARQQALALGTSQPTKPKVAQGGGGGRATKPPEAPAMASPPCCPVGRLRGGSLGWWEPLCVSCC